MSKEKLYFQNLDEVFCKPLESHLHDARIDGLKEIKLIEAILDNDNKEHIWCTTFGDVVERSYCKKKECISYSSKSGRGVCEHRGSLYLYGDEVTIEVTEAVC